MPDGFLDGVERLLAGASEGAVAEAAGAVAVGLEALAREEGLDGP